MKIAPVTLWEKKADWLVWIAGALCFFLLFAQSSEKINNSNIDAAGGKFNTKNIDELLLSPDEIIFADKKSFVKGTLRFQWAGDSLLFSENSRENLYNYIYRNKLKKTGKKPVGNQGFSVRPVPQ